MSRRITALCVLAAISAALMILVAAPDELEPSRAIADYQLSRAAHGKIWE
jgi:hypothetical protein